VNPASNPPPAFTVDWTDEASEDLTAAYAAYFLVRQGIRVTIAERIATQLLADDPVHNGTVVSEGLYRVVVSPLRVHYEIDLLARVVRVTHVGYFAV
jgi:hypothetical protein